MSDKEKKISPAPPKQNTGRNEKTQPNNKDWIGESRGDFDRIRKGAEIPPRPKKPSKPSNNKND